MNTRQADRIIKAGKEVTVYNTHFDETFTATFIKRDRYNLYTAQGGIYDRGELEVVENDKEKIMYLITYLPKHDGPQLYWTRCTSWVEDVNLAKQFDSIDNAQTEIDKANRRGLAWDKEPGVLGIATILVTI